MVSRRIIFAGFFLCVPVLVAAQDRIELETTTIKGNKELPRVLYIVPWQDVTPTRKPEQELVLHSLFGDLFDPVMPEDFQ